MRPTVLAAMLALVLPVAAAAMPAASGHPATPSYVTAAINDPARAADRHDDARRQLAAVMTFAEVKPGQKVVELDPGSGYWTRVFSAIVGPSGRVYTVWPDEMAKYSTKSLANWQKLVTTAHYGNVSLLEQPAARFDVPNGIDLVFTSQNYHDYQDVYKRQVWRF